VKLHLKTTLLVSIITLAVMTALIFLISARLVEALRDEEKMRAEVEATNLAEHYGHWGSEAEEAHRVAALMQETRLGQINVRVWKRAGDKFLQIITTSPRQREMPAVAATQLFRQQIARIESEFMIENSNFNYRVFVPIAREGQVIGAVEVSDHLNTLPTVMKRFLGTFVLLMLIAVGLIALTTYFLFRKLIYHPLEQLLVVIARAKQGELQAQAPVQRSDEIGILTQEFNGLLGQIHLMANECEQQRLYLRERVRAATAELQEHNEKLEATNLELWHTTRRLTQLERLAAAGQTATQFAHEVGTPLNVISCHAQLMQAELCADPVAAAERTAVILEQTERIEQIVREMMDRTRAESTEFAPLDLNALVKGLADATAPTLTKRGVNLELSLAPSLPPIEGDAEKLQQVFLNLINNSLDAMTEGGQLTITTRHETAPAGSATASHVSATLVDTGCGMTPEVKARLFDPFSTRKSASQGSGLGLMIVNQVMQEHRAQILVESAPQQGACFTLLFSSAKGQPA
jgi:two-component system, NtrC family, sensor kinase